ncbi:hypothetical protein [Pseudarthrobacter sp. LMD1-1-1.1]
MNATFFSGATENNVGIMMAEGWLLSVHRDSAVCDGRFRRFEADAAAV